MTCDEKPNLTPSSHSERLAILVDDFGVPAWIKNMPPCPSCGADPSNMEIRGFGVHLNARYFGDFSVELMCNECYAGFSFHWRRACKTLQEFLNVLKNGCEHQPVVQHTIPEVESNLSAIILEEMRGC